MKSGINGLTVALLIGVLIGLVLTPDGRDWLRHPTLLLGSANASSTDPAAPETPATRTQPVAARPTPAVRITPLDQRMATGQLTIGVFGDSMGDGVWTGLYREMQGAPGVEVIKFSEVSTGLSRYDYVDIQTKTRRQLAERKVDAAVVVFGTNDAQAISENGRIHAFGSPEWKAVYARRIDDLIALFRENDVAVYWVGMPRMKRATFDARMTIINDVASERMKALGVSYVPTVAITSDGEGAYAAYLATTPGGRPRLMRANDGIHMSMAGYERLTAPVAQRIRHDAGLDRAASAPAASPAG